MREEHSLTQTDLADRLGRAQSFVSKYERGDRQLDLVEVEEVCRGLGVGLSELLMAWSPDALLDPPEALRGPPQVVGEARVRYQSTSRGGALVLASMSPGELREGSSTPGDTLCVSAETRRLLARWLQSGTLTPWMRVLGEILTMQGAWASGRSPLLLPEHLEELVDAFASVATSRELEQLVAFLRRATAEQRCVVATLRDEASDESQ